MPCDSLTTQHDGAYRLVRRNSHEWVALMQRANLSGPVQPGCTGRHYAALVQAVGGRSKTWPYGVPGLWCNVVDAEAWFAQVHAVEGMINAAAPGAIGADFPTAMAAAYANQIKALDDPDWYMAFGAGGCAEAVSAMISNIEFGACLLEKLEEAGGASVVPSVPTPEAPGEQMLNTGLIVAGVVMALVIAARK